MSINKRKPIYLEILVIVHGQSEYFIAEYIKSNLKIKMEIDAENKGKNSIQITGLKARLSNTVYKNRKSFFKKYSDIQVDEKGNPKNFKLFIIMDTDDCSEIMKNDYITKKMFEKHWLYDYIVPVYNIKELEDVLKSSGIKYENRNKGEYIKIFPVNRNELDIDQIKKFGKAIKKSDKTTNMHLFIEECIKIRSAY